MAKDDLMKAVMAYVLGLCYLHNARMGTFNEFRTFDDANTKHDNNCAHWVRKVQNTCWRHLNEQITLNGACSDFECWAASHTKQAFEKQLAE